MDGIIANPEIRLAQELVLETGCNLFLTGRAGTGKTTFLHNIRHNLEKRCVVCAPTGVAAINCGGVTLHSFFQLPFGPLVPGSSREQRFRFTKQKRDIIRNLDLLVIDEISMVRADLLDGVDAVLRKIRRRSDPFGGVQLLLIGDLYQLPPVVKEHERGLLSNHYPSTFFFGSHGLQETLLYTIELQHVYRQEDPTFIDILNRIREGRELSQALGALNQQVAGSLIERGSTEIITLCSHNRPADRINDTRLQKLDSTPHRFSAEVEGEFAESVFPAEDCLELKKGAQVMFLRNDPSPEKRYFNGRIGNITLVSQDEIRVRCAEDKEDIVVERAIWENTEYKLDPESMEISENVIGTFQQFPLKLAWAITIHKSQGLTFDAAIVDATRAFAAGQVYVALSRCRTLEGLTLTEPVPASAVRVDPSIHTFFENGVFAPGKKELQEAKIRYQQQLLVNCFNFESLQRAQNRMAGFLRSNRALVTLKGLPDADPIRNQVEQEITRVGASFLRQLRDLFTPGLLITEDGPVKERLSKANQYFQEKFEQIYGPWLLTTVLESDNKELSKQGKAMLKELRRQVAIKQAAIASFGTDFTPSNYLRAIGRAEVEQTKKAAAKKNLDATLPDDHPHQALLDTLKEWRKEKSKQENVIPFQVIHYRTLGLIALHLPENITDLKRVRGIGDKLAGRYGEDLLKIVQSYRQQHDSETRQLQTKMDS